MLSPGWLRGEMLVLKGKIRYPVLSFLGKSLQIGFFSRSMLTGLYQHFNFFSLLIK
jgi:hypothetical protein